MKEKNQGNVSEKSACLPLISPFDSTVLRSGNMELSMPSSMVREIGPIYKPKKNTPRAQFHRFLATEDVKRAMDVVKKLGDQGRSLEELDTSRWHPCVQLSYSPFRAWICCWPLPGKRGCERAKDLFHVLKASGGVTPNVNDIHMASRHFGVFTFLLDHAPEIIDPCAVDSQGMTVLMNILEPDSKSSHDRDLKRDELGVRCIKLMQTRNVLNLNMVDSQGRSALTLAICGLRMNSLKALLRLVPDVSLEPSHGDASIFKHQVYFEIRWLGFVGNTEKGQKDACKMVSDAQLKLAKYRAGLMPTLVHALRNVPLVLCIIIQDYMDCRVKAAVI